MKKPSCTLGPMKYTPLLLLHFPFITHPRLLYLAVTSALRFRVSKCPITLSSSKCVATCLVEGLEDIFSTYAAGDRTALTFIKSVLFRIRLGDLLANLVQRWLGKLVGQRKLTR